MLTVVETSNTITSIGSFAFAGTILESFVIPETVTSIGAEAFQNTKLHNIITKDAIKECFRKEIFDRKRQEFENHSPYVRKILAEILEEHRMKTLIKNIDSLAVGYGLTIEDICSTLEIDIEEYLDAKMRIAEE